MSQLPVNPIRVLILEDSPDAGEAIAGLLRSEPGFAVSTSRFAYGEGVRSARRSEPDVVVLLADALVAADPVAAVEELEAAAPGSAIVVLTSSSAHTARDFVLAGARDCLMPPYDRLSLTESLRQVHLHEQRRRERLAATLGAGLRPHRCRIVSVHGAKGGVGTTTVAVNLAVALRQLTGERVALVDASLQTGDVGVALNLVASTGMDDLLPHLNQLDVDLLSKVLVTHTSGVKVLLAPRDLERAEAIGSDELRRILSFMSGHFDYIVIDTASTLDAAGLAALDHCDQIVLVTTPEIPALKNTGRFLMLSRRLGYPTEKILLAVNRASSRQAVSLGEIERSLGLKPTATIPSAGGLFIRAANRGEVVVLSNAWRGPSQSLYRLARKVAVATQPQKRPAGVAGLLRGLGARFTRRQSPAPAAPKPVAAKPNELTG